LKNRAGGNKAEAPALLAGIYGLIDEVSKQQIRKQNTAE
jgi:hypothetical protein